VAHAFDKGGDYKADEESVIRASFRKMGQKNGNTEKGAVLGKERGANN